jgi:hypothetical protein
VSPSHAFFTSRNYANHLAENLTQSLNSKTPNFPLYFSFINHLVFFLTSSDYAGPNPSMYAQLSHSRSTSATLMEPHDVDNSSDNTSSKPIKRSVSSTSAEAVRHDDCNSFAKPRKEPRHHFWRNPCSLDTLILFGDALLTLTPCLFLVLSFLALSANNQPVSLPRGQIVEQAAKLGPTLFPVIFAAIVGRLMRTYALWRAERGASLGILEQLNGSQNVLAALERAILLPGLGFLSIVIVLLWALSPLGGQSALRVLDRKSLTSSSAITLYYFNTTGSETAISGDFSSASSGSFTRSTLNAIFQASLVSINRVRDSDLWGNIKIPVLQYVPSYVAGQSKDGWYDFDENVYESPYSALTGLVVSGLKIDVETTFTMESSYFNLTCMEPVFFNVTGRLTTGKDDWGGFDKWVGALSLRGTNSSKLFNGFPEARFFTGSFDSYMIDSNYLYTPTDDPKPRYNLIYASQGAQMTPEIAAYNCTVGVFHVETEVVCGRECHVKRQRPSQRAIWSPSGWPWASRSRVPETNLLHWLSTATAGRSAVVSPIDFYVNGYDQPFVSEILDITYRNVSGLALAKRLQSLLNTGWQIGYQSSAIARQPSSNITALAISTNFSKSDTEAGGIGYPTSATNATMVKRADVFVTNMIWVSVTISLSLILLLCAFVSMVFKYGTNAPDILGYVSSMTRDNPNFEQVPEGDRMDGLQRARALRHLRVQIVDVRPWDEDGHVMLRSLGRERG